MENWKDITNYEGLYMVSDLGNIKRIYKNGKTRIMIGGIQNGGYKYVSLTKDSVSKVKTIHRIVAIHFIENPFNKSDVNHKNSDRKDNRVLNLEWNTRSENLKHGYRSGNRKSSMIGKSGENSINGKQVLQFSKDYKLLNCFTSAVCAEIKTGVSRSNISSVCRGLRRCSGGYIWQFKK